MSQINIILLVIAIFSTCTGCGVNIAAGSTFTSTPDFATAILPHTVIPPSTPFSVTPVSTLNIVTGPTLISIEGTTTTQVNVRAEPSTVGDSLGIVPAFSKVQVIGREEYGKWYQIIYPESSDGKGWVAVAYVQIDAPVEIPIVEIGSGSGETISGLVIQGINVRSGPGTTYESYGTLIPNDVVSVTGKDPSGAWMEIEFSNSPDRKGWAAFEFLQVNNPNSLPIIGNAAQTTESETPANAAPLSTARVLTAIQDGDSMQAPLTKVFLSATSARALQITGQVSSPSGDTEDWVQFTSTSKAITIQVTCSSDTLNVELWNNMAIENNLSLTCGDKQLVTITPHIDYFLRFSYTITNESRYAEYILSLEIIR